MPNVPGHENWFQFTFPLPNVQNAPKPSQANYSPENLAPLIEGFAAILGKNPNEIRLVYENNTPDQPSDNIAVDHPLDQAYSTDPCPQSKSPALLRYEAFAKKSSLLKLYEEKSPAGIKFFQDSC